MPKIFDKFTEKIPTFGEGGGAKPVGPKSQLLPKICFACFPNLEREMKNIRNPLESFFSLGVPPLGKALASIWLRHATEVKISSKLDENILVVI